MMLINISTILFVGASIVCPPKYYVFLLFSINAGYTPVFVYSYNCR